MPCNIAVVATVRDDAGNTSCLGVYASMYEYTGVGVDPTTWLSQSLLPVWQSSVQRSATDLKDTSPFKILYGNTGFDIRSNNFVGYDEKIYDFYQYYMQVVSGQITFSSSDEALTTLQSKSQELLGMTFDDANNPIYGFSGIEAQAQQLGLNTSWIIEPANLTITKSSQADLDKLKATDPLFASLNQEGSREATLGKLIVLQLTDILNNGQDIVIHSCLHALFSQ